MFVDVYQDGLDIDRCIFLALCHDIVESVAGDILIYTGVSKGKQASSRSCNTD